MPCQAGSTCHTVNPPTPAALPHNVLATVASAYSPYGFWIPSPTIPPLVPSDQFAAPPQAVPTSYTLFAQIPMAPLVPYPTVPQPTIAHAPVP
eukprot:8994878-Ditylum_brightwellii.AAC.1